MEETRLDIKQKSEYRKNKIAKTEKLLYELNNLKPGLDREPLLRELFPDMGTNCKIKSPLLVSISDYLHIGNNVLIAPNSYVNFDVPDNSIVIGNPGKIIHKDNATEDYINRKV